MSSDYHERRAARYREDAAKELGKSAGEQQKAAKAEEAASKAEASAFKTTSESTARSKLREAERKRGECSTARKRAADHSKKAADATSKAAVEDKAATTARANDLKAEQRKAEQRQRQEVRKRQRDQRAEDLSQHEQAARVGALERRTRSVEAALQAARLEAPQKVTILFLAGNPQGTGRHDLRLDREVWEIRDNLLKTEFRDVINFEVHPAVRLSDITEALNRFKPDVVHFSGHGSDTVLVFDDPHGNPQPVDFAQFGMLLQAAAKPVRLALFNACDSAQQAVLATEFVDAAIGMDTSIDDDAAKTFAGAFYNSLGYANSVAKAFQQAVAHVTATKGTLSGSPRLYARDGVPANEMVIVAPPSSTSAP